MKTKNKFTVVTLILVLLLASCKDDEPDIRTVSDLRNDFANLTINAGTNDITIESLNEGQFWDMRIIVPESASNTNRVPLIISLHGAANTNSNLYKDTQCLLEPGFENLEAVLISPSSKGYLWFQGASQLQITAIVDLATRYLPVKASKVAITGYSDGAIGAWYYAQHYSDLFSAAIPISGLYNSADSNGVVRPIQTPIYVVHGTADQLFNYDTSATLIQASIDAGSDITFVSATELEHYNSCTYVPYLVDAAAWLEDTVWN